MGGGGGQGQSDMAACVGLQRSPCLKSGHWKTKAPTSARSQVQSIQKFDSKSKGVSQNSGGAGAEQALLPQPFSAREQAASQRRQAPAHPRGGRITGFRRVLSLFHDRRRKGGSAPADGSSGSGWHSSKPAGHLLYTNSAANVRPRPPRWLSRLPCSPSSPLPPPIHSAVLATHLCVLHPNPTCSPALPPASRHPPHAPPPAPHPCPTLTRRSSRFLGTGLV